MCAGGGESREAPRVIGSRLGEAASGFVCLRQAQAVLHGDAGDEDADEGDDGVAERLDGEPRHVLVTRARPAARPTLRRGQYPKSPSPLNPRKSAQASFGLICVIRVLFPPALRAAVQAVRRALGDLAGCPSAPPRAAAAVV